MPHHEQHEQHASHEDPHVQCPLSNGESYDNDVNDLSNHYEMENRKFNNHRHGTAITGAEDEWGHGNMCDKIRLILRSHRFHMIILCLIVIECLLVASEVVLSEIESLFFGSSKHQTDSVARHINNATTHEPPLYDENDESTPSGSHQVFYVAEHICKFGSTAILAFFIVEIVFKVLFDPKSFTKFLELLDAVIIMLSFGLNIFIITRNDDIHSITGLITLLR